MSDRVNSIIKEVHALIKVCYPDYEFKISYLTIFSQSEEDFQSLMSEMQQLGDESEANNGYKYKLNSPINCLGQQIELIRIRKPDVHRKELGCTDLTYKKDDYEKLKAIALEKGFDVIMRKNYEMIELSDFKINAYAYLVRELTRGKGFHDGKSWITSLIIFLSLLL